MQMKMTLYGVYRKKPVTPLHLEISHVANRGCGVTGCVFTRDSPVTPRDTPGRRFPADDPAGYLTWFSIVRGSFAPGG